MTSRSILANQPAGDGFVVLERLQANPQLSPRTLSSWCPAATFTQTKERALKAGASAFVQKPWNDDELLALISQLASPPGDFVSSGPNTAGS
jgi:CheY-like chemotaxis protein